MRGARTLGACGWRLLLACGLLFAMGGAARAQDTTVTRIALEADDSEERLILRADGPLGFEHQEVSSQLLTLTLLDAVLSDDVQAVPRRLNGKPGATLQRVVVATGRGLQLQIRHASGMRPLLQRQTDGLDVVFAASSLLSLPPEGCRLALPLCHC